jgi:hypothetical protein
MTVQLVKVGKLEPTGGGEGDTVDHVPLVLWAGTEPSAVIAYRKHRHLLRSGITQEFVGLGPGESWRVSHRMHQGGTAPEGTDVYDPGSAAAADVDGDGSQELILVRRTGAVEVWRGGKQLGASPGPGESGDYDLKATFEARLPEREELYLLFNRHPSADARAGGGAPYLLVRVGSPVPSRVALQGLPPNVRRVMAVGALNLPGSRQVDELLAVSLVDEKGQLAPYLSRHRVDGAALGPPRKIYQPFDIEANPSFAFVPQSDRAVAMSPTDGHLLFFAPAKPVNWVRLVDLGGLAREAFPVQWFGVSDAGAATKAVVRREDALYAVDEEGRFQAQEGGRWVARKEAKPFSFYRLPRRGSPEEGAFDRVGVFPARGSADEFLIVEARHPQARGLTDEEREAAAKRFLSPWQLEIAANSGTVSMDVAGRVYAHQIAKELAKRGSTEEVKTVEDWKRLAPLSHEMVVQKTREDHQFALSSALFSPLNEGAKIPEDCPDPEGYRAWLQALTLPAKTVGTLVRRWTAISSFEIGAVPPEDGPGDVVAPMVSYRSTRDGDVTAVLPVAGAPDASVPGGFYVVRAKGTR